jgi:hypothetical protein
MMLAGIPLPPPAIAELASMVRAIGADELADRLERAVQDDVKILALTIDERAIILNMLDDPPDELAELRAMLLNERQWRQAQGLYVEKPGRMSTVITEFGVRHSYSGARASGPPPVARPTTPPENLAFQPTARL